MSQNGQTHFRHLAAIAERSCYIPSRQKSLRFHGSGVNKQDEVWIWGATGNKGVKGTVTLNQKLFQDSPYARPLHWHEGSKHTKADKWSNTIYMQAFSQSYNLTYF